MRLLPSVLAALALLSPLSAEAQKGKKSDQAPAPEGIVWVRAGDPEVKAAVAQARRSLPEFLAHLARPGPGEHGFVIKYNLLPEPGKAENIWVDVLSASPGSILGRLANVPVDPRFKLGEKVTVGDGDIIDWGYVGGDGVMRGHFTTRALLPRYDKDEADAVRREFNW